MLKKVKASVKGEKSRFKVEPQNNQVYISHYFPSLLKQHNLSVFVVVENA